MPSVQPQSRAAPGSIGSATPVLDRRGQANRKGSRLKCESIGESSAPFFQRVPRALDLPDPTRLFTAEQLDKKLKVLFIVSQPTGSPAISGAREPIVTVDSGGAPELVQHGKAGLVGPVDGVGALTANLITLIDDPVKRRELGGHGRQRVLGYLNAQRMADEVEAVDRLVVNGSSA